MAKRIIFQTQETQSFFILFLQATNTYLIKDGCTQLKSLSEDGRTQLTPHKGKR